MPTTLSVVSSRKAVSQLASLQSRLRNLRERVEGIAPKIQHTALAMGSAFVHGKLEASFAADGHALFTVANIDPSAVYGTALFAIGEFLGGRAGEIAYSLSVGELCIAGYKFGKDSTGPSSATQAAAQTLRTATAVANAGH